MPKFGRVWIVATIAYCSVIFYLSSQPHLGESPPWWLDWPNSDKLVHIVLFGGLAGIVSIGLLRSNGWALPWRVMLLGPVAFATLYGATDEVHQWFVPPRSCDIFDLFADATGATIVAGIIIVGRALLIRSAPDALDAGNSPGLPED